MANSVNCLVIIIAKDDHNIADVGLRFKIKHFFIFFISLNSSLIIVIWTYRVNYRNALGRLRVRMNIILLVRPESTAFGAGFLCFTGDVLFF